MTFYSVKRSLFILALVCFSLAPSSQNTHILNKIKKNHFSDWQVEQGLKMFSFMDKAQSSSGERIVSANRVLQDTVGIENPLCSTCKNLITTVDALISNLKVQFALEAALSAVCGIKLAWGECWGMVHMAGGAIADNLVLFLLEQNYFCENVVPVCRNQHYELLDAWEYIDRILEDKPEHIQGDDFVDNLYKEMAANNDARQTFKLIQMADGHLDLDYVAGTDTDCPEYIVGCRTYCGFPTDGSKGAGLHGAFGCDLPLTTFELMNHFINEEVKPDAIFWTGDIVPHDFWNYDQEYIERYQNTFTSQLKTQFPDMAIYPIHGNHDFSLMNSQNMSDHDPMIDFNSQIWSEWMTPEANEEYKRLGFYTEKIVMKDGTETKTNLIAMNTQSCYIFNFYLMSQRNDPGNELVWLEQTLADIEAKGESALIIGHVPVGEQCLHEYSIRYKSLVERYQHVIRFSMFGHVHDEFHGIHRSFSSENPLGVNFWTGSITTYSDRLPSFRMYEVDTETFLPVKIHTYIFNITEENPVWHHDHEFTDYYDLKDLSPSTMDDLSDRFLNDEALSMKLYNTRTQHVDLIDSCDAECRLDKYCWTRNSVYSENKSCRQKGSNSVIEDPQMTLFEKTSDPWYTKLQVE